MVLIAAGDVSGQVFASGLVDEVRMDVARVGFGSGKRIFGSVQAQHLLEDPDVVIQGNRVLHLRCRVAPLTDPSGHSKSHPGHRAGQLRTLGAVPEQVSPGGPLRANS